MPSLDEHRAIALGAVERWLSNQPLSHRPSEESDPTVLRRWRWTVDASVPGSREIPAFDLVIQNDFPIAPPRIELPFTEPLSVPNLESTRALCLTSGAAFGSGAAPEEIIGSLLLSFREKYFQPWSGGELDSEFLREPKNYWRLHVGNHRAIRITGGISIRELLQIEGHESESIQEGTLLQQRGTLLFGGSDKQRDSYLATLAAETKQTHVHICVIRVELPGALKPGQFPKSVRDLHRLLSRLLSGQNLKSTLSKLIHGVPARRPVVVILESKHISYGFMVMPWSWSNPLSSTKGSLVPLEVFRVDPAWMLGRDERPEVYQRQRQKVLVFGAGSLGSGVINQLARAGVGHIDVIDNETFDAANTARHELGMKSFGRQKAPELAAKIQRDVPPCNARGVTTSAERYLDSAKMHEYDLVIDVTGSASVRLKLDALCGGLPDAPDRVIGWMEPYVVAAHCVTLLGKSRWLPSDGVDPLRALEAYDWGDDVFSNEPGCSAVFQNYTSASLSYAVGLVAEESIAALDKRIKNSRVRSLVRSESHISANHGKGVRRPWVDPKTDGFVERAWHE